MCIYTYTDIYIYKNTHTATQLKAKSNLTAKNWNPGKNN